MKVDSVYDFSPKALVEVKSWLEPWFLTRCPCAAVAPAVPFPAAMATIAGTVPLLGYWRFGDGASPFADTSGHPYGASPAAATGSGTALTANYTPGALPSADDDGAVGLNGHDSTAGVTLLAPDPPPYRFNLSVSTDYMTVCAWVKPSANSSTFTVTVAGVWGADVFGPCGWRLAMNYPNRTLTYERKTAGTPKLFLSATTGGVPADDWTFVVATYGASGISMYVNGVLVTTTFGSRGGLPTFNSGVFFGTDGPSFLPAALDEVSVWGAALTAAQVATLWGAGGVATSDALTGTFVTAAYTAATTDQVILASNGTYTVTLYTAVGNGFKQLTVKNTGVGTVTLDGAGSETIDGSATLALTAGHAATIISDGANWYAIGGY